MKVSIILGTRPEIIKLAPVIFELINNKIDFFIIHSNQHYDYLLDRVFFEDLQLPLPKYDLKINSETPGEMIGEMMIKLEKVVLKEDPDVIIVQGDTNTALAGALVSSKCGIKLVHIEAGARSFDRKMPEEVNRVIIDAISDKLFVATKEEELNVLKEGISKEKIHIVGNTTPDTLILIDKIINQDRLAKFMLKPNKYVPITLHRPANVDSKESLNEVFALLTEAKSEYLKDYDFIWPMHPRTAKNIKKFKLAVPAFIKVIEPQNYLDMITLIKFAKIIFTDSGGVLEEAYLLRKPCITIRDSVEFKFTIKSKMNFLVHRSKKLLRKALDYHLNIKKYDWKYPYKKNISSEIVREILLKNSII